MEYREVERLADQLRETLGVEFEAKMRVLGATEKAEEFRVAFLVNAKTAGLINAKNEKDREFQRLDVLFESDTYQALRSKLSIRQAEADIETIERKRVDALIGLTKAWLYSQQGTGHLLVQCTTDEMLRYEEAVDHVRTTYNPGEVFPFIELADWARGHGFVTVDVPETGLGREL